MTITIRIDLDAPHDDEDDVEIASVLTEVADRILKGSIPLPVSQFNLDDVAVVTIEGEDDGPGAATDRFIVALSALGYRVVEISDNKRPFLTYEIHPVGKADSAPTCPGCKRHVTWDWCQDMFWTGAMPCKVFTLEMPPLTDTEARQGQYDQAAEGDERGVDVNACASCGAIIGMSALCAQFGGPVFNHDEFGVVDWEKYSAPCPQPTLEEAQAAFPEDTPL